MVSLLERQKRYSDSPETISALDLASTRVRAFADAYTQLSYRKTKTGAIPVRPYLIGLLDKISAAAVAPHIKVSHAISDLELPAEKAVALGLFMNEAITNTSKYAFPGRANGAIHIALAAAGPGWTFSIKDDGCGIARGPGDATSGMGRGLMDAFAVQAGAVLTVESSEAGTEMVLAAA